MKYKVKGHTEPKTDKHFLDQGYLIKYKIVYYNNHINNIVKTNYIYSKYYLYPEELSTRYGAKNGDFYILSPEPLYETSIEDSIILRWESEKESKESKKDIYKFNRIKNQARKKQSNFLYAIYGEKFGFERLLNIFHNSINYRKKTLYKFISEYNCYLNNVYLEKHFITKSKEKEVFYEN